MTKKSAMIRMLTCPNATKAWAVASQLRSPTCSLSPHSNHYPSLAISQNPTTTTEATMPLAAIFEEPSGQIIAAKSKAVRWSSAWPNSKSVWYRPLLIAKERNWPSNSRNQLQLGVEFPKPPWQPLTGRHRRRTGGESSANSSQNTTFRHRYRCFRETRFSRRASVRRRRFTCQSLGLSLRTQAMKMTTVRSKIRAARTTMTTICALMMTRRTKTTQWWRVKETSVAAISNLRALIDLRLQV